MAWIPAMNAVKCKKVILSISSVLNWNFYNLYKYYLRFTTTSKADCAEDKFPLAISLGLFASLVHDPDTVRYALEKHISMCDGYPAYIYTYCVILLTFRHVIALYILMSVLDERVGSDLNKTHYSNFIRFFIVGYFCGYMMVCMFGISMLLKG